MTSLATWNNYSRALQVIDKKGQETNITLRFKQFAIKLLKGVHLSSIKLRQGRSGARRYFSPLIDTKTLESCCLKLENATPGDAFRRHGLPCPVIYWFMVTPSKSVRHGVIKKKLSPHRGRKGDLSCDVSLQSLIYVREWLIDLGPAPFNTRPVARSCKDTSHILGSALCVLRPGDCPVYSGQQS